MALRFGLLAAVLAGEKNRDPLEPADHALGRCKGGFGTKLHILCDATGPPLHFELSAGNVHDSKKCASVLDGADEALYLENGEAIPWPLALVGDKGYRANYIDEGLLKLGITPVIPSKSNENRDNRLVDFDKSAYKRRSIVECLIGWLKESRRVATRFEKTAINFGGMVKLAFIHRYLRICAPC
jgi:transposase